MRVLKESGIFGRFKNFAETLTKPKQGKPTYTEEDILRAKRILEEDIRPQDIANLKKGIIDAQTQVVEIPFFGPIQPGQITYQVIKPSADFQKMVNSTPDDICRQQLISESDQFLKSIGRNGIH
ncbi:MAG: hypothetical protein Q8P80_01435 [Candidatus Levybacteria bacterium]|nr:hypothetical protein [Candidatus Levybacteria bacterium]